jgi:hypothetical protein
MSQFIIHIYMKMSQGNSLCSFLKQAKMSFFSTKSENRRAEQVLRGGGCGSGELAPVTKGRIWRKGVGG